MIDYAPMTKLAEDTKNIIDGYYLERECLTAEMKAIGASASHLAFVFKQTYALSPANYLNQKRLNHAKKLLAETDTPIITVAGEIGFDSLSAFYTFFKKRTNITPGNFRRTLKIDKEE